MSKRTGTKKESVFDKVFAVMSEQGYTPEQIKETYRGLLKQAYQEVRQELEPKGAGDEADPQPSDGESGKPNSERFPDVLALWTKYGGTAEEFDTLTVDQLVGLGVKQSEVAEELAKKAWEASGGSPEEIISHVWSSKHSRWRRNTSVTSIAMGLSRKTGTSGIRSARTSRLM